MGGTSEKVFWGKVMTAEQPKFLLYYFDTLDNMWHDCEGFFETEQEAKEEMMTMIKCFDSGVIAEGDFAIIPNDGKAWKKYRPLDLGDRIYNGKPYYPEWRQNQ
jgi:hypothetical protein